MVEPLPALADLDFSTPSNRARIESAEVDEIEACLTEIERLLGQTVDRKGRWGELRRHLRFGQPHDWHEISTFDWPSVQSDIEAAKIGETDPVPVPDIDLGRLSETKLTGQATTGLAWKNMDDDGFERLLFDLLGNLQGYRNVQWLSRTNAADRGRDLSLDRVLEDGSGDMRVERVIVQAKHYTSKSVSPIDVHGTLASLPLWGKIDALIIATSSRFTSDAIALIDQHNNQPNSVRIEMWPDSKLEVLLGPRPTLAITHKLRD
ncbi:restriction endonuclease [Arthrobacter sp. 260]|uniref:restriction endonuclease n=1 Tax=Arthrobacter sp. 260 TaxID=2735314 RepID=UPI001C112E69